LTERTLEDFAHPAMKREGGGPDGKRNGLHGFGVRGFGSLRFGEPD
jgi:hypothetical protein